MLPRFLRFLIATTLLPCAMARADGSYEEILQEAMRMQYAPVPGASPDRPYHLAYERLAEAAQREPARWEAFALRGVNRCEVAVLCRGILATTLGDLRARGAAQADLDAKEEGGNAYIQQCVADATRDFQIMERNMQVLGQVLREQVDYASACLKYALAQFLEARGGAPGAIADFESLYRRGWQPRECAEFIARSYSELGADAFHGGDFPLAQGYWDKGLKWAQSDETRRILLTNKAGAFEMDNEFGLAEKVLREQAEREPHRPGHWKNLGLVLGYENRLRAALQAYDEARRLCREMGGPIFVGVLHGNAWLKPAMIHGKLLEEDGDLRLAWRLFLEYRDMHGDDYNFSLNFGDFAFALGAYDLAWTYLSRARDLHPFCPNPYQMLLEVAPRTAGKTDEIRARIQKAQEDLQQARERYLPRSETGSIKRLCAGLRDLADETAPVTPAGRLDPDPLAGHGPDRLPPWLQAAAAKRRPFRPYDPALDDAPEQAPPPKPVGPAPAPRRPPHALLPIVLACTLLLGTSLAAYLLIRRRAA